MERASALPKQGSDSLQAKAGLLPPLADPSLTPPRSIAEIQPAQRKKDTPASFGSAEALSARAGKAACVSPGAGIFI
ncbi:MAG: hypothetical protein ABSF48_22660 [Thermodesulfobacteriota bacterium]